MKERHKHAISTRFIIEISMEPYENKRPHKQEVAVLPRFEYQAGVYGNERNLIFQVHLKTGF